MPYKTFWHKPDKIVFSEVIGNFTEAELMEVSQQIRDEYLAKGIKPVHVICDARSITEYPRNVMMIRRASEIYLKHPSMGWVIFIGFDNPLVRFLSNAVAQISGVNFRHVGTLEDAEAILEKIDFSSSESA